MPYKSERLIRASDSEDAEFAEDNIKAVRDYARERVHGWHCASAFRRVFGGGYTEQEAYTAAMGFERNPVYLREFDRALNGTPFEQLWNPRIAAHELLSVLRHPATKQSVRITAVKELDVLFDITTIDEFGRTQGTKKLADFYRSEAEATEARQAAAEARKTAKRHPEPGTPEAEALEASADV